LEPLAEMEESRRKGARTFGPERQLGPVANLAVLVVVDPVHDPGPGARRFPIGFRRQLPRARDQLRKAERALRTKLQRALVRQRHAGQPAGRAGTGQEQSLKQATSALIDRGQVELSTK